MEIKEGLGEKGKKRNFQHKVWVSINVIYGWGRWRLILWGTNKRQNDLELFPKKRRMGEMTYEP